MKIFRTPLLKRFPEVLPSGRRKVIRLRLTVLLPSFIFLVIWVALMRMRILPDLGPGWVSYRLHDYIYLPIKGLLFNRPYPYSLVGWLLVLGLLSAAAGSFLLDRSFILQPHRRLLRWLFTHPIPFSEYLILHCTPWLRRFGFRSSLLRRALHHEWLLAGDQLLRLPDSRRDAGRCLEFARLSNWMVQIEATFGEMDSISLLARWHWAYVIIRARAAFSVFVDKRSHPGNFKPAIKRLLNTTAVIFHDFKNLDDSWLVQPPLEDELFSIEAIGRDLCRLLYLNMVADHSEITLPIPFENFPQNPSAQRQKTLLVQAVHCVDQRRFRLHAIALQIEQALQNPAAFSQLRSLDMLPTTPESWELALSVALHAALDTKNYRIGVAFFEAQDTAVFALSLGCGQYPAVSAGWMSLVSAFPRQEHYLTVASLRWLALEPEKAAFNRLVEWDKNLIDSPDLALAQLGLHILHDAGGPTEVSLDKPQ